MRRPVSILALASILLITLATPVSAEPPGFRFSVRTTGVEANVFWEECEEDTPEPGTTTCTFVSLFAFDGTQRVNHEQFEGSFACLFIDVVEFTAEQGQVVRSEFGCSEDVDVTLARRLASGRLTGTFTVTAIECDPEGLCEETGERDVTVNATWTGIGPLTRFHYRSMEHPIGNVETRCKFMESGKGLRREAVATATIDGLQLGETSFGFLSEGKFSFSVKCQ